MGTGRTEVTDSILKYCVFLQVIRKDLEDCEAHILALETLVSSNPTNGTKFERLYAEWKLLYNAVRVRSIFAKVF